MNATTTAQAEKVAAELVSYFTRATAQTPTATQDENLLAAMNAWMEDSGRMAELPENRMFSDTVYKLTQ